MLPYIDGNKVPVSKIAMRVKPNARTAIGAELVLDSLLIEVVASDGILASQIYDLFPRKIDMHVAVARADAAIARPHYVFVERWN